MSVCTKAIRRVESPPCPMMLAARMKYGIASSGKLSRPAKTRCGRIDKGMPEVSHTMRNEVPISTMNIGSVRKRPSASRPKVRAMVISVLEIHHRAGKRRRAPYPPPDLACAQEHERPARRHGQVGQPHRLQHHRRELAGCADAEGMPATVVDEEGEENEDDHPDQERETPAIRWRKR